MTTPQTNLADQNILGYRIQSRIGEGGFGEVWRATAPGGLPKAVKIVFGFHDEKLAQNELRALNKVREIRHPFLLSLERIDVVDGKLVVISELADKSLKQRFRECIKSDLSGIPREELLKYMRDAADGLDYLCERHLLQHLDVKPENLLLVAGHVKVADYGLVKDVRNNNSMMSGLTPTYAAPELFDGRPSQTSDQYSLAIVYQEMLTGVRPYDGKTPAQLARQHMLGRPNLEALPRGDQAVVAKALSKDPTHRFASCTEFYEELQRRKNSVPKQKRTTTLGDSPDSRGETIMLTESNLPRTHRSSVATPLAPLNCDGSQAAFHPTLIIGVGRTGCQTVKHYKEMLYRRFGHNGALPGLRTLCIDTDIHDLSGITNSSEEIRFRDEEVLPIPLKDSNAYRKTGDKYSRWLSRRWIFNIPRSFSTEGIRPLGRLAFADHSKAIFDRLHRSIPDLIDSAGIQETANQVDLKPDMTPRVFIVGSVSGGVGSGLMADLAYAVRTVLQEHGLSDENLVGLLFHGYNGSGDGALAASNAYACLREICHYAKLGYPGDRSIGLPAFDDEDHPAFSDIYFQHCGSEDYKHHSLSVACYLYLDTVTECSDFFKRCRNGRDEDGNTRLRTLGLTRFEMQQDRLRERFITFLQKQMLAMWGGEEDALQSTFNVEAHARTLIESVNVNIETIINHGIRFNEYLHDGEIVSQLRNVCVNTTTKPGESHLDQINQNITKFLSTVATDRSSDISGEDLVQKTIEPLADALWMGIQKLLDEPTVRLAGAIRAHQAVQDSLDEIQAEIGNLIERTIERIHDFEFAEGIQLEAQYETFCKLRASESALRWSEAIVARLKKSDGDLRSEFDSVTAFLESLTGRVVSITHTEPLELNGPDYGAIVSESLSKDLATFVTRLEKSIEDEYLSSAGGLRKLALEDPVNGSNLLAEVIRVETRSLVTDQIRRMDLDKVIDRAQPSNAELTQSVKHYLEQCTPRLMDCGGAHRLLLALPPATSGERLAKLMESLHAPPSIVRGTDGDVVFCLEGENVAADNVALKILEECPEATELIERISSRLDVEWRPLTGLG